MPADAAAAPVAAAAAIPDGGACRLLHADVALPLCRIVLARATDLEASSVRSLVVQPALLRTRPLLCPLPTSQRYSLYLQPSSSRGAVETLHKTVLPPRGRRMHRAGGPHPSLPTSPHITPSLPTSPHLSPSLPTSPHPSPPLPTSPAQAPAPPRRRRLCGDAKPPRRARPLESGRGLGGVGGDGARAAAGRAARGERAEERTASSSEMN